MKILVPIDGSSYSENSIEFVASRATLLGSEPEIYLLAVLETLPSNASRLINKDELKHYYKDEADKILKKPAKRLKKAGFHVEVLHALGSAAQQIASEAERINADLIIMGSRGRTALAGLFLGSVTSGVLALTKQPILILRNKPVPEDNALRVGIAVDGSQYGIAAVDYSVKHKALFGENPVTYLINVASDYAGAVMPDMAGMSLPTLNESEILELQKKEFEEAVAPVRDQLQTAGLATKEVCLVGNPGDEIAAFARKQELDLLVMGSHGYGSFKAAIMGSTATRIAAQGNVPILLIRC